jgi:hypothetical protein
MNFVRRMAMTVDDYLDWAAQREQPRTELIGGQIVALSPVEVESFF